MLHPQIPVDLFMPDTLIYFLFWGNKISGNITQLRFPDSVNSIW